MSTHWKMLLLLYNMSMNNTWHVESLLNWIYKWTIITLLALPSWKLLHLFWLLRVWHLILLPSVISTNRYRTTYQKQRLSVLSALWYIPLNRNKSRIWRIWTTTTTTYSATIIVAKRDWNMVFLLYKALKVLKLFEETHCNKWRKYLKSVFSSMSKHPRHGRAACIQIFPRL